MLDRFKTQNFNSNLLFVGLGCDTEINLQPDVRKILNALKKPRSVKAKGVANDWSVTISKNITNQIDKLPFKVAKKELEKHQLNIRKIILYSNATPIKSHSGIGFLCCFCKEQFKIPGELKIHTLEKHDNVEKMLFMKGMPLPSYVVKLDITALKCKVCDKDIEGLEQLIVHLQTVHNELMYTDIKNHILPFKFDGDTLKCVLCPTSYERFKLLQEHMNTHYRNFNCEICNSSFVNKRTLRSHMSRHRQGEFTCNFCPKIFETQNKKLNHERFVHIIGDQKRNKCPHCGEKFTTYSKKSEHMVNVHGAEPRLLKCMACDKTFDRRDKLTRHTKRDHLLERNFECEHCDMKFFGKKEHNMHMLKHTGEKQYSCRVCLKAFGRKHTLKEHLRIHADDRRFKCEQCGHTFVQKCSWKHHMWSKHEENV